MTTPPSVPRPPPEESRPQHKGLAERLLASVASLGVGSAIELLGRLLLVPVGLFCWGRERYGEWLVLLGGASFLRLADLGFQSYVGNRFAASYAREQLQEIRFVFQSAAKAQAVVAGLVVALVVILEQTVSLQAILQVRTLSRLECGMVAGLLAGEVLIGVPSGLLAALYRSTNRLPRAALVGTVQHLVIIVMTLGMMAWRADFRTLAACRLVFAFGVALVTFIDIRTLYPWLWRRDPSCTMRAGLSMLPSAAFFILPVLADFLGNQLSLLIVQHSMDAAEVSRFATHRSMINLGQIGGLLLMAAAWPELTALHARGEHERLRRLYRSLTKLSVWSVGLTTCALLVLARWLYPLWTAKSLDIDGVTFVLLALRAVLWAAWNVSVTLLLATSRHKAATLTLAASAIGTSVLTALLTPALGIRGAALAGLGCDVTLCSWIVIVMACREVRLPRLVYLLNAGLDAVRGVAAPALAAIGICLFTPPWSAATFVVLAFAVPVTGIAMWSGLSADERAIGQRLLARRPLEAALERQPS